MAEDTGFRKIVKLLYAADPTLCIRVDGLPPNVGVQLEKVDESFAEYWTMTEQGKGVATFQTIPGGYYLTYMGYKQQIQVQELQPDASAIMWLVQEMDDGSVMLYTQYDGDGNGNVVDNYNANDSPHNMIWGYTYNGTDAQKWIISPSSLPEP